MTKKNIPFLFLASYTLPRIIMVQCEMGVSPIVVTFQIHPLSTEQWLLEKEYVTGEYQQINICRPNSLPKTNSSPLKNDGGKTILSFWNCLLGGQVNFRGGMVLVEYGKNITCTHITHIIYIYIKTYVSMMEIIIYTMYIHVFQDIYIIIICCNHLTSHVTCSEINRGYRQSLSVTTNEMPHRSQSK